MGSGYDLRKFQKGKGAETIEEAFSRIVSGGKLGYKTVIEKKKIPPNCSKCGKLGAEAQKFCPECGGKMFVPITNCPKCSNDLEENEKFCTECGHKIL